MPPLLVPGALYVPSEIDHPIRRETRGIVMHWTAGHERGDVLTLDGPNVDCHLYGAKDGDLYQFLDLRSAAWHAMHTANYTCIGFETEGFGEAWTKAQMATIVEACAFVAERFEVPTRYVDPPGEWDGFFGHRNLSMYGPRVDGNNHTDTVPEGIGWPKFIGQVKAVTDVGPIRKPRRPLPIDPGSIPGSTTLRLVVGVGKNRRKFPGWENAAGPIAWVAKKGETMKDMDPRIAWQETVWPKDPAKRGTPEGKAEVINVCRNLYRRFLEPRGF